MIQLHDADSGDFLGEITEEQLQFLIDHLEETDESDQDYYIDGDTVEMLDDEGADADLMDLLRGIIGDRDGVEVRWSGEA